MQNVACPACGAPVEFRSHASVQAVCGFCQTTVIKDADSVRNLGKMSEVLEDYSPIQVGTSGKFGGKTFSVVGRIQLRYSAGMWNEWYLAYDDGSTGWLGDSSGLYTLTKDSPEFVTDPATIPQFEALRPASTHNLGGQSWLTAEVREGECIAGQGELPFRIGGGWRIRVADFRRNSQFLTLDYSDGAVPRIYVGQAVTLDQLQCQLLRDDDEVKSSAGKFKGKVDALDCPSCGSGIKFAPGVTQTLVCPACHSQIDASNPKAQVLAASNAVQQMATTLELGASAMINGATHQIIGMMQRADDENTVWTEYLLYNTRGGFIWLVETDSAWYKAKVHTDWPAWSGGDSINLSGKPFRKVSDYPSTVVYAAGAFNWRVSVGDATRIVEFEAQGNTLSAEISDAEITWSYANVVAADQIRAWFGKDIAADKQATSNVGIKWFIIALLILNAIPMLGGGMLNWIIAGIGVLAIYFPYLWITDGKNSGK